jgi:hypothetical protein
MDLNGEVRCSEVVKVFIGTGKQEITVYPNPIINSTINLELVNQPAGTYKIKLLNNMGQQVLVINIEHAEGSSAELISIEQELSKGVYHLQVIKPNDEMITNELIY